MKQIDDVIHRLDEIVDLCERQRLRAGYFAALYRHMTLAVKRGMETGQFQDPDRMERLDIYFAQRYFDAFDAYYRGQRPTDAWRVAFEATANRRLAIVQQMLLGINAHINLDLGIAAAETAPGQDLPGLKRDFDQINRVIAGLTDQVMAEIGEVSPWFALLDRLGGRTDKAVVNFSIDVARAQAWRLAEQVAPAEGSGRDAIIRRRDGEVALFAGLVKRPGRLMTLVTWLIALREEQDERRVIRALNDKLEAIAARERAQEAAV